MTTTINLNGISELDFTNGIASVSTHDDATTITLAALGVTSIGIIAPTEIHVSGSPVTSSGNITLSWNNETANQVFAGPTTGSPGTPGFRALVAADIPNIAGDVTGAFSAVSVIKLRGASLDSTIGTAGAGQNGQVVYWDNPSSSYKLKTVVTSVSWDQIQNAAGNLTLANAGFTTTFNQTSAVNWNWANTTSATASGYTVAYGNGSSATTSVTVSGLTIAVGDFVIVCGSGSSNLPAFTDNGTAGGNTYTSYSTQTTSAFGRLSLCQVTTKTATSVTATVAAGTVSVVVVIIHGATFALGGNSQTNASTFGSGDSGTAVTNPIFTTTNANGLIFAFAQSQPATSAESVSAGWTIQQSAGPNSGSNIYYNGVATQNTPSNTPLVAFQPPTWTLTGTSFSWGFTIEVVNAGLANNSQSPNIQLLGTYYNGSSSAVDTWTIENAIANAINGQPILKITHSGSPTTANVEFDTNIAVVNSTAATNVAGQSSPFIKLAGQSWNGASTIADFWMLQAIPGNGTNPQSVLALTHSGSINAAIGLQANLVTGAQFGTTVTGLTNTLEIFANSSAQQNEIRLYNNTGGTMFGQIGCGVNSGAGVNYMEMRAASLVGCAFGIAPTATGTGPYFLFGSSIDWTTRTGTIAVMQVGGNPATFNHNYLRFSPASGSALFQVLQLTPVINQGAVQGPFNITNCNITSATSATLTVSASTGFVNGQTIVIANCTGTNNAQLNGSWALQSGAGTTTLVIAGSGWVTGNHAEATGTIQMGATGAYTMLLINPTVTNTNASAGSNKLIDCQIGGTSLFNIDDTGLLYLPNSVNAGFGAGPAGTAVTTTTKGGGTGPTTAQTIVQYEKIVVNGSTYWIPLMQ